MLFGSFWIWHKSVTLRVPKNPLCRYYGGRNILVVYGCSIKVAHSSYKILQNATQWRHFQSENQLWHKCIWYQFISIYIVTDKLFSFKSQINILRKLYLRNLRPKFKILKKKEKNRKKEQKPPFPQTYILIKGVINTNESWEDIYMKLYY